MDILERLRDPVNNWNSGGRFEAANEIERLRAKLLQCATELEEAANMMRPSLNGLASIYVSAARVAREL